MQGVAITAMHSIKGELLILSIGRQYQNSMYNFVLFN